MPHPAHACPRLKPFDEKDWGQIGAGFSHALALDMTQVWQAQADREFRPCRVHVGWQPEALAIYAELHDRDIFNPVVTFNEPAYNRGDVFEVFLRPLPQPAYYELHVNPNNQKLQLRFPSQDMVKRMRELTPPGTDPHDLVKVREEIFHSQVRIEAENQLWRVFVRIPWANVVEEGSPFGPGSQFLLSLSRYDYSRGRSAPILSSTSPHQQRNFHRQEEWALLTLKE
jgi:hypothetical protein